MMSYQFDLDIQKFLKSFADIQTGNICLQQKFNIEVTDDMLMFEDGREEAVWLYNYDMLKSRGKLNIENEARGLILNSECKIVSMSFPRFFNSVEQAAAEIDWSQAFGEVKHDGTLVVIYAYKGQYFIQTRRRAMAEGPIAGNRDISFADAVTALLKEKFNEPFKAFRESNQEEKYSWAFEYVSPDNRIITPYEGSSLILLGAFNLDLGKEVNPIYVEQFADLHGFARPAFKKLASIEEAKAVLPTMQYLQEGLVIVDGRLRRIKIKNPPYLAINRIKNMGQDLKPRHFADLVLKGDATEIASYYPGYKPILSFLQKVLVEHLEGVEELWLKTKDIYPRKEFAKAVSRHPLRHLLFLARDGHIKDMTDALDRISPEFLVEAAEEYQKEEFKTAFEEAIE